MKNTITPEEHARIKRRRWRQTLAFLFFHYPSFVPKKQETKKKLLCRR